MGQFSAQRQNCEKINHLNCLIIIEDSLASKMIRLLPKIKGLPEDFTQKVEKRKEVFQATSEEHSKIRCEFLTQKIKFDNLLDLSLSTEDKDLQASLIVSKETWTNQMYQTLPNG